MVWSGLAGWPGCRKLRRISSLVTICQPEYHRKRYGTQPCSNPTRWPSTMLRARCMSCQAPAGVSRSSSTRRAHIDGGAARPVAGGLGHRNVRRVRVGAVAPSARGDQAQRLDPTVHRGGVPRLGADPGTALHRRESAGVVAPQEISYRWSRQCPARPAGTVTVSQRRDDRPAAYAVLRRLLFLVPAERIHGLVFAALRGVTAAGPVRRRLSRRLAPIDPVLARPGFGVHFPRPP